MIFLDKKNILCIDTPQAETNQKEYTITAGGKLRTSINKKVIIYHKRNYKIHDRNNLGKNMNIIACYDRALYKPPTITHEHINTILGLFIDYDEDTGKKRNFIPFSHHSKIERTNEILKHHTYPHQITNQEYKFFSQHTPHKKLQDYNTPEDKNTLEDIISLLYIATNLYGDFMIKNETLTTIKLHFPLFGQYKEYAQIRETLANKLREYEISIHTTTITGNDHDTRQLSSNDYELTYLFSQIHQSIENIKQISNIPDRSPLLSFLEQHKMSEDVASIIERSTIKYLTVQ